MSDISDLMNALIAPVKDQLKNEMVSGMDTASRILVVTKRMAENLNIFDQSTYTDILSQQAQKHFDATKNMSNYELLTYMKGDFYDH